MTIPSRAAAIAVAVAASLGLGVICTASSAQAAPGLDLPNTFTRMVLEDTKAPAGTDKYVAIDAQLHGTRTATLAEAEQKAGGDFFDVPRVGEDDQPMSGLIEGYDLHADKSEPGGIGYDEDGGSIIEPDHQFDVSDDGTVENHAGGYLGFDDTLDHLALTDEARYVVAGSTRGDSPTTLVANLDSYDAATGTAVISGSASSSVFYPDARVYAGDSFSATGTLGEFVISVSGITAGTKSVELEQKLGEDQVDKVNVALDDEAEVAPLVLTNPAKASDGYAANQAFTFAGTGEKGSKVTVRNAKGTLLAQNIEVDGQGEWKWTRANMGTSAYSLKFIQDEGSPTEKSTELLDFKPGAVPAPTVTLTNPAKASDGYVENQAFTFAGTGTPGKTITVKNTAGTVLADDIPVTSEGTWEWTRANMRTSVYNLDFIQDSGLPTEQKTTLRGFAGHPAPVSPVTLTNPAKASDGYVENQAFTFAGTGTPGKTITVKNTAGTVLADDIPVTSEGTWEWTRANMRTSVYSLDFIQDSGLPTEQKTTLRGFAGHPAPASPVSVTNPADPKAGYTANTSFTFRGKAAVDSALTIQNAAGTEIAKDIPVSKDGDWEWTRANMGTSVWKLTFIQDKGKPTEAKFTLGNFAPKA
ncbi:hypothetical protein AX769_02425 [Frondihabitans sp. PAMC 28766]|uniref:hypothetical protein n=1 Tax=Frondihabitans sp. PAMC 28766 TaxID=1795630 RepID=UPI00078B76AF|nr:hypothetical protein [Frondihabitans sp. PAMC 28766]AMM19196.1 hypothetical protein AX769_02425 [Frondihabitans sp. PAMC 28766]